MLKAPYPVLIQVPGGSPGFGSAAIVKWASQTSNLKRKLFIGTERFIDGSAASYARAGIVSEISTSKIRKHIPGLVALFLFFLGWLERCGLSNKKVHERVAERSHATKKMIKTIWGTCR